MGYLFVMTFPGACTWSKTLTAFSTKDFQHCKVPSSTFITAGAERKLCNGYPSNDHHFSVRRAGQTSGQYQISANYRRFSFYPAAIMAGFSCFRAIPVRAVYGHTTAWFVTRTVIHGYSRRNDSPICARFKACCNSRSNGHVTAKSWRYVHQYARPASGFIRRFWAF